MKDLFRQCMWPSEYPFCSGHHNNEDTIDISHYDSNIDQCYASAAQPQHAHEKV